MVNFYGSPPLNYLSKYIAESTNYELDVMKLPSVALSKNGFEYEAFLLNNVGSKKTVTIKSRLKLPAYCIYILQYVFNTYAAIKLPLGKEKYDLGVGETSFGSFVMFMYKIFGRVKKTAFMSGDVLPIFDKRVLPYYLHSSNAVIKTVDKIFVYAQLFLRKLGIKNDVVWYANQKVRAWDLENGLVAKSFFIAPAVTVDKDEALENITTKRTKHLLAYIGRLDENAGVDVSLKALALIIQQIPDAKIIFVGGNEVSVKKYQELAKELGVEKSVDFRGFVEKSEDAIKIISQAKMGLALYKPEKENVSMYADISKPKEYLRAGLPVIMTEGGHSLGTELQDFGAAVLAKYDPAAIASSLIKVLSNNDEYNDLLKGVRKAIERYDYRENFRFVIDSIKK